MTTGEDWLLARPSPELALWAAGDAIVLRKLGAPILTFGDVCATAATMRLGRLLPVLVPQLCELGAAYIEQGVVRFPYAEFVRFEERSADTDGIDAFEDLWQWSPFSVELSTTGWLQGESFRYNTRFYLGRSPIALERRGCFVKFRGEIYRLDRHMFALLEAIEHFHGLSRDERTDVAALRRFADIKELAYDVGAQLDTLLSKERVIVPARIGLDVILDDRQRLTFVPKIDGVSDTAFRQSFLALDDVDGVYSCETEEGGRVRVVLDESQREVLRRMQRVRDVSGPKRDEILRAPLAVFDGVADVVDVDLSMFGPRVKGIGDLPFMAVPFMRSCRSGIFDDPGEEGPSPARRCDLGLECRYADGTKESVTFSSRNELLEFVEAADDAARQRLTHVLFRDKSLPLDEPLLDKLRQLRAAVTRKPSVRPSQDRRNRQFLLVYTNEDELEFQKSYDVGDEHAAAKLPRALLPTTTLADYQVQGVRWLHRNFRLRRGGCLLADDMGVGKTLQTLVFLASLIEDHALGGENVDPSLPPWRPILIVAPVILLENEVWEENMRQFFAGEGAVFEPWVTLHGSTLRRFRQKGASGRETEIGRSVLDIEALCQHRVVFTNYETITAYQHSFASMKDRWSVVVTDESQEYKTPSSKVSHALKSLSPIFKVACTGTPVETRLLDVWNIIDYLQPGDLLGSAAEFSKKYESGDADDTDSSSTESGPRVSRIDRLRRTLRFGADDAFLLRRDKATVLKNLTKKHEHKLRCHLSDAQRQRHLAILRRAREKNGEHPFELIHELMKLYQHPALADRSNRTDPEEAIDACPKLATLLSELARIRGLGEKALVFVRSLTMQQILAGAIQCRFGIEVDIVNGAADRHAGTRSARVTRSDMLRRFKETPGFNVLILSPDVASIGLTIVEANHVFHYGRWWNPAKEAQANDRVYRIGQQRDVHVYQLIAVDPQGRFIGFDERLDAVIERRRAMASDFLAAMPDEREIERELLEDLSRDEAPGHGAEADRGSDLPEHPLGMHDIRVGSPWRFEAAVAALWEKQGARVVLTPKGSDDGADVIAIWPDRIELVQCKHTVGRNGLDAKILDEVREAFDKYVAQRLRRFKGTMPIECVVATNGRQTRTTRKQAASYDVKVIDEEALESLLQRHPFTSADVALWVGRRRSSMRHVQADLDKIAVI